ncbi:MULTISPECIES: enoyl-CoA hydratase [unclassified Acidovorax]|uniref:enoyl-CoA hydratase n=1 Tax=unclassified Acidovorax TaxID=2684926 RepID=UPI0028831427|nr:MULTISPECIES: enoyl-CoA hydratase [unclassified Acidovorax]
MTDTTTPATTPANASQDILVHTEAGITTITFNRLDKKNSITRVMYAALADAFDAAAQDAAVRVVVLQGDVAIFSAGNDIGDFLQQTPSTQDSPVFRFLRGIATFPKPVIAAVCGPAVGIGTTMLFHCDLVYAGDNAAFSMPFVNLGLCPEAGSSLLVPRMFGYHRAAEALLLGEPFMAEAALEVGLVNRVVPPTECNMVAQTQARKLAAKPLSSLIETKRLMKHDQQPAVLERIAQEGESFGRMLVQPAAREAFSAFMEKRRPDFSAN